MTPTFLGDTFVFSDRPVSGDECRRTDLRPSICGTAASDPAAESQA